jgi:hypothetical protein
MIHRRTEYIVACDVPFCGHVEAHNCDTRAEAEQSARKYGWQPIPRKRWVCPACAEKAREKYTTTLTQPKEN